MAKDEVDVDVLIVGGSLVGLSASLFLARHGVSHLVAERHSGTAIHPRAALVNQRSIEIYRGVDLEDEIKEAAAKEFVQNGAIMSVESLGGRELEWYYREINEGVEALSPSPRLFITQIGLEPILRDRAQQLGSELAYSTEVTALEQDDDGVNATLLDRSSGSERTVRTKYVIAADGARSPVRERLGIPMRGRGTFSDSITIYFRADVRELVGDRNLSVIYVFNPRLQGFFRFSIAGDAGFLVVNSAVDEEGRRTTKVGEDTSDEKCIEYVREALGAPELSIEIENVQRWAATADWAERFQERRVFLAGDAAHVMPPTGGFGGNCGIADADNIAWKLALVLRGAAGRELLATYDAERRPVGAFTVEQAYTRYVVRLDPALGKDDLQPFVDDAAIELGHRYRSAAILEEGNRDDALYEEPRMPSGRPGFRAPHLVLRRGGESISTFDLAGRGFALLAGPDGAAWCEAGAAAAAKVGIELSAYRIGAGGDAEDLEGRFADAYGAGAAGAALVRPDNFVAWRTQRAAADGEPVLVDVFERILARKAAIPA